MTTLTKNQKIGIAAAATAVVGGIVGYLFYKRKAKKALTEPAKKDAAPLREATAPVQDAANG